MRSSVIGCWDFTSPVATWAIWLAAMGQSLAKRADGFWSTLFATGRAIFTAAAIGAAKPDPRVFATVCDHLGLPPAAVVHAGNDPENDVLAPARLGMPAVWVNRTASDWPARGAYPDHTVRDLAHLADLLGC